MNWLTSKNIRASFRSYMKAVDELLELAGGSIEIFNESGGSPTWTPTSCRAAWKVDLLNALSHVNQCRAWHEMLFDLGSPQLIQPNWNVYRSFFHLRMHISRQYSSYTTRAGSIDESGKITRKETVESDTNNVTLLVLDRSWGMKDWPKNVAEITALVEKCSPEIKQEVAEAITKATHKIERWKKAISDISTIGI